MVNHAILTVVNPKVKKKDSGKIQTPKFLLKVFKIKLSDSLTYLSPPNERNPKLNFPV